MSQDIRQEGMTLAGDLSEATLQAMYVGMVRIRRFEERVAELLEQGEILCPTHLCIGQEGVAVGVCSALRRDDYVFGGHRSHGHYLAKGGNMNLLMAEMFGKETGCSRGYGGSMHLYAPEVGMLGTVPIVGATIPIAVGAALASVMEGTDRVSVAFFGDGATEEGEFHESLNYASLRKLPVLFVCENNLFSSHLRLLERQPVDNIYQSGEAHGMPGYRIDGNSVIEVLNTTQQAVQRARAGQGPTLIECRTYRWRGHVGPRWDLDVGLRDKEEVDAWVKRCPIEGLKAHLLGQGIMTESEAAEFEGKTDEEVEMSLAFAYQSPNPDESELMNHVFRS
ncbi:MAG: thiamine pyrophosphate-dependent dehydrogenase E1 component subunit alpha [Chloroflexota bacterium]